MQSAERRMQNENKKMRKENKSRGLSLALCFAFFILHSPLLMAAAPAPSPPAPVSPLAAPDNTYRAPSDSEAFAFLLLDAVNWVSEAYVRPVSRVELLHAALSGLYERARRPVPRDLRRRIERAEKESTVQTASAANTPPLVPALAPRRPPIVDDRPLLELLRSVRADLSRAENLDGTDPLCVACQAMLHALDPYSGVISAKEDRHALGDGSERDGFGLQVLEDGKRVIILDVLPGSPAQQAGLRRGDEILCVYDSDGRRRKVKESLNVLNGRAPLLKSQLGPFALPEPITLSYRRLPLRSLPKSGGDEEGGVHRATLTWRRFRPESVFGVARRDDNSWNYWLDAKRKIAYLRLSYLVESTPDELSDILTALRGDGLRGLILDLRWCPGGVLTGSVKTAELFLGEGTIATVQYRNQPEDVYRSTSEGKHNGFPMVVLINSDSTGGAELIAAALQDHHRAVLVGQRTHGKGNVQKLRPLGTIVLKVTSGSIVRPCGKPLHRFPDSKLDDAWGVYPDPGREFRVSAELSHALRTWYEELTMRPGSSTKRLLLDDPLTDPQRNAALEVLTIR